MLVDDANKANGTLLIEAIDQAIANLIKLSQNQYRDIQLRIILFTNCDDDNFQINYPQDVARNLIRNNIILDSFVLQQNNLDIKNITQTSGGLCYLINNNDQKTNYFESEFLLSIVSRHYLQFKPILDENVNFHLLNNRPFDSKVEQIIRPHQLENPVITVQQMVADFKYIRNLNRIQKELIRVNSHYSDCSDFKLSPIKNDTNFFNAEIYGPEDSPYKGGIFKLYIQIPIDYPYKPPTIRFITKIFHCNISKNGFIGIDLLHKDEWSPALSIPTILITIRSLLTDPNPNESLDSQIAYIYLHDKPRYEYIARVWTIKYATNN